MWWLSYAESGNIIYHIKKGEFRWEKNLIPEYAWFNGSAHYTLIGDRIDTELYKHILTNKYLEIRMKIAGGFIGGVVITLIILKLMAPGMMIHETKSFYDFDRTVETIISNAETNGWKVPKVYDFQQTISAEGIGFIGKMKVIELCHPQYAYNLLHLDENKNVGVMMPCVFAVYEKADGVTYIASMNLDFIGKLFGGSISDVMTEVAKEDKKILNFVD
ncbi:MAG: DUF302 domain-containing protein [Candidatus Electryoneaceae bacterium]|nr:DUF302 domain-containing protein [Candidatus Electryoneaceae bacterium]